MNHFNATTQASIYRPASRTPASHVDSHEPRSQAVYMDDYDSDQLTPRETLLLLCGFAAIVAAAAPWIVL